jgi:hypothetical protein
MTLCAISAGSMQAFVVQDPCTKNKNFTRKALIKSGKTTSHQYQYMTFLGRIQVAIDPILDRIFYEGQNSVFM